MADITKGLGPVKRFGTRYGRTLKYKRAKIEIEQKKSHKCPFCLKPAVHRLSVGIWKCDKCNETFTARAYTVGSKLTLAEQAAQLVAEAPDMEMEEKEEEQ